jgi:Tfp pilus assembly protein PilV
MSGAEGFTLVEVSLSIVVLMVGVLTITSSTLRIDALRRKNHDSALAHLAISQVAETLQAHAAKARFEVDGDAVNTWAESFLSLAKADYADGFPVASFTALPGASQAGSVQFITNESLTDESLGVVMGMPRDLNRDGDSSDTNVDEDAHLLAVIIHVAWSGPNGVEEQTHPLWVQGD